VKGAFRMRSDLRQRAVPARGLASRSWAALGLRPAGTRTGPRGAPIGAPPPFVFYRKVNAFVTFLCSTPSQRRSASRMVFSSPRMRGEEGGNREEGLFTLAPSSGGGRQRVRPAGRHGRNIQGVGRGYMAAASLGIAKICRRTALILPSALNLIPVLSRWGEHEMRDFMRVSLTTGASPFAPAGWDRGV